MILMYFVLFVFFVVKLFHQAKKKYAICSMLKEPSMNVLDLAVLALVALCAFAGFRRGLIRTVYRLVSFFIAIFLATRLYAPVARLLRDSPLYTSIQNSIARALNLEGVVGNLGGQAMARPMEVIDSLPLPLSMRERLHTYNTPDMYELLRVGTIEDYISGFFANMAINGIAIVAVFILVLLILSIAGAALDIVAKLPVINTFNNLGGLAVGLALGVALAWIAIVVMTMFFATGANANMYELMEGSLFTRWVMDSMMPQFTAVALTT